MYRQKERAMRWHQVQQVILLIYTWIIHENIYIVEKIFWIISCLKKTQTNRYSLTVSCVPMTLKRDVIVHSDKNVQKCNHGGAFIAFLNAVAPHYEAAEMHFFHWHACVHFHSVVNVIGNQFTIIYRARQRPTRSEQLTTGFHMRRLKKNKEKVSTRFITCVRQFLDTYFTTLTMFVNCKFIYY